MKVSKFREVGNAEMGHHSSKSKYFLKEKEGDCTCGK